MEDLSLLAESQGTSGSVQVPTQEGGSELLPVGPRVGINLHISASKTLPRNQSSADPKVEVNTNITIQSPVTAPVNSKQKNVLKERFILKNSEETPTKKDDFETSVENPLPLTTDDENHLVPANVALTFTEDELYHLKHCRARAYSKVNLKKRQHLPASLSAYFLKEWQAVYPNSSLTGRQLVVAFDSLNNVTLAGVESIPGVKKSTRGRKRKISYSPPSSPDLGDRKEAVKKPKTDTAEEIAEVTVDEVKDSESVISLSYHTDRQWTQAMLSNLLYCYQRTQVARDVGGDLEAQWKILYPNSNLTARNLKSRLTVYQRTHSERSCPKRPTKEKSPTPTPPPRPRSVTVPTPSALNEVVPFSWTEERVTNMFVCLDQAREEMDSVDSAVVNTRWHQLWSEKHPDCVQVTKEMLYSRYLEHAKKASRIYLTKDHKAAVNNQEKPRVVKEDLKEVEEQKAKNEELKLKIKEEGVEKTNGVIKTTEVPLVTNGIQWTEELLSELWEDKIFVEDRLRCIQDDYFYELLWERWSNRHPENKDTPEDLRERLGRYKLKKNATTTKNGSDTDESVEAVVKLEPDIGGIKQEEADSELLDTNESPKDEAEYLVKEEPRDVESVPRSAWVCPNHYIHVFYDDEDKSYECILTDQLLQMRNALQIKFVGYDLSKPGKKPAGFARMLLSEWKRHYPASQENTKTISMKIGRYDRAPAMLAQSVKNPTNGRINWSPAMLENIRTTREKAVSVVGEGAGPVLTKQWRTEWELIYPDLNIDWKQVISRYHYHYGGERRESGESDSRGSERAGYTPLGGQQDEDDSEKEEENIRGFRQWTNAMQEDLLILRDILMQDDPSLDPDSKQFSRALLTAFQAKHPRSMESARSLLSKLKDPAPELPSESPQGKKVQQQEGQQLVTQQVQQVQQPKVNPAVEIISDIEGFTDWNLGMVRDFISCMDRARRKYSDMKEVDPQMKLVPLLLSEWKTMYPESEETVKTFLVRIRFLKVNKEGIKQRLGQHDLLPRMSQEGEPPPVPAPEPPPAPPTTSSTPPTTSSTPEHKFVWDANLMMPIVIATRAKAIAKQKREATQNKRVSYAKIWIKEFKKVYPNCPYTANNLSVHYWYWTSRDANKDATPVKKEEKEVGVKKEVPANQISASWSEDRIGELQRVGKKVRAMLVDAANSNNDRSTLEYSKLLHSVWIKLHPDTHETEESLVEVLSLHSDVVSDVPEVTLVQKGKKSKEPKEKWTPRHNKVLREIIGKLKENKQYQKKSLLGEWKNLFPRSGGWDELRRRIEDCDLTLPADSHLVEVIQKDDEKPKETPEVTHVEEKVKQAKPPLKEGEKSGLNARGQMRWTQLAVSDLLECHKLGLEAKINSPDMKLADLVHLKFCERHPYCPIAPNVLLTKCYILRSELKSGKLVLTNEREDTGEKYRGETGLRTWTRPMLQELVDSRRRAIIKRKQAGGGNRNSVLGDIWMQEFQSVYPDYRSSKKNLFRKYKWWRARRQEERKDGPGLDLVARKTRDLGEDLYQEVRALLESSQVILPPFVSSKVIMLAQQWVDSDTQCREEEEEKQKLMEEVKEPHCESEDKSNIKVEAELVEDQTGVITLPGGAVLVAKTTPSSPSSTPNKSQRNTEPPDVSITLGSLKPKQEAPSPPPRVVTALARLSLPLACLPTLLAVYREVRDRYKFLVTQDYVVSWTLLLRERLHTAGLGEQVYSSLTTDRLDSLVQMILEESVGRAVNMKTVGRPSQPVSCSRDLLSRLQGHLVQSGGDSTQTAWQTWVQQSSAQTRNMPALSANTQDLPALPVKSQDLPTLSANTQDLPVLSARQYFSLVELVFPPTSGQTNWEEVSVEADLGEVWLQMGGDVVEEGPAPGRRRVTMRKGAQGGHLGLEQVGTWWRRTRHLGTCPRTRVRGPVRVANPRLFWSTARLSLLKKVSQEAGRRWARQGRGVRRRGGSLGQRVAIGFRRQVPGCSLQDGCILGKLVADMRREKKEIAGREEAEIRVLVEDYLEYLDNESNIETLEEVGEELDKTKVKQEDGLPDYTRDEDVLEYLREGEKPGKRTNGSAVWNSVSLGLLLRARDAARRRRREWTDWAVARHGSLQAAFSNPRVRVPKPDDLLVEEWGKVRPNQAGISAWTLNSYLKKFEGLKDSLVCQQEEERRRQLVRDAPATTLQYLPRSNIPKYDLAKLASLTKLPSEVVDLVSTRQRAKLRGEEEGSRLTFLQLWAEQWEEEGRNLHGVEGKNLQGVDGRDLQSRLLSLQGLSSVRHRLRHAVVTKVVEEDMKEEDDDLSSFEYEDPALLGRNCVFPTVMDLPISVVVRRKEPVGNISKKEMVENLVESIGFSNLGIPVVMPVRQVLEEEGVKMRSKLSYLSSSSDEARLDRTVARHKTFLCFVNDCGAKFDNLNNLKNHIELHSRGGIGKSNKTTFGQRMAGRNICLAIINDCIREM